jgi:hypothetical protein
MKRLPILFLALTFLACTDTQLQKLAKITRSVAETTNQLSIDLPQLYQSGALTQDEAVKVANLLKRVTLANDQVNAMIEPLAKLDPNTKANLSQVLAPIANALDEQSLSDILNIKNESAREKLRLSLTAIRASLVLAQALLS